MGAFAAAGAGIAGVGSFAQIAAVAGLGSGIANIASQALAKPPPARGSVSQMIIQANAPQPYVMGEGYFAGVMRHQTGYGGRVDKVDNPYLFHAVVYGGGGPYQSISPRVDYGTIPSWYSGYLYTDTQLGACPEPDALAPQWAGATGWGAAYKLSGQAAIGWSFKFDKDGKRFASGLPLTGAYIQGAKVYDPRLDSTFPGGSGSCQLGNEATYVYSANPALHAGTYAYGRYQNGKRTMGIGLPADAIDWQVVAAWANTCEANGWSMFGVLFEPGNRWDNLKDICAAGSAEPIPGAVLSFRYDAPAVALDTITAEDNAGDDDSVVAQQSYRDRVNTVLPSYRSPNHNWEMVQAAEVQVSSYVTEDGEVRQVEWPFNFVKGVNQATQLAAYRLVNSRELHPIELHCKPRLRAYRPGDCLHIDRPDLGLDTDAIVLAREFDPATMTVKLTLMGETPAKHAYALGQTGTAPDTPALGQTPQERDETTGNNEIPLGYLTSLISTSYTTDADPADGLLQATAPGGVVTMHVEDHTRTYSDKPTPVPITGGNFTLEDDGTTPLAVSTLYHVYYDDSDRAGGAVDIKITRDPQKAATAGEYPGRHYIGSLMTPASGGSSSGGGTVPPGWTPGDWTTPIT